MAARVAAKPGSELVNDDTAKPTETAAVDPSRRFDPPSPAALLAEFAAQVRFWSRLPLPSVGPADDLAEPPPFARAIRMLPWAALIVAAPTAIAVAILAPTSLPGLAVGALAVAVQAWVTGAFHEDGFADVADGFGGGHTAERRLEIMKDSRIGAFGGTAIAAQFVLRAALIGAAADRFGPLAGLAVLAVAALARVLPLILMTVLPPARPDGLGRSAGRPERRPLAAAVIGAAVLAFALLPAVAGPAAFVTALVLALAAVLGLGLLARAKIGGFTGDVIGAGTIATEIAAFVGLLA